MGFTGLIKAKQGGAKRALRELLTRILAKDAKEPQSADAITLAATGSSFSGGAGTLTTSTLSRPGLRAVFIVPPAAESLPTHISFDIRR